MSRRRDENAPLDDAAIEWEEIAPRVVEVELPQYSPNRLENWRKRQLLVGKSRVERYKQLQRRNKKKEKQ